MNEHIERLVRHYPDLEDEEQAIWDAFIALKETFENGGKLLLAGNGGSAADSDHIVGELMKGFKRKRELPESTRNQLKDAGDDGYIGEHLQGALPAISLVSQSALMTAFSNDVAADLMFAQQVYGYGKKGDVFWGISTSGNSKNIMNAAIVAKSKGLKTICLTGKDGGKLKNICDITIRAPFDETYRIQESHLPIYHTICIMLEEEFFS